MLPEGRSDHWRRARRCTLISPGFTDTEFITPTRDPDELASLTARRDAMAMPPQAVAETIAFAPAQPDSVDKEPSSRVCQDSAHLQF